MCLISVYTMRNKIGDFCVCDCVLGDFLAIFDRYFRSKKIASDFCPQLTTSAGALVMQVLHAIKRVVGILVVYWRNRRPQVYTYLTLMASASAQCNKTKCSMTPKDAQNIAKGSLSDILSNVSQ